MTPLSERIESILQYLLTERRTPSKEGNIQLHKITNPETGRQINVGTALQYKQDSPAYQAAKAYMDQHRGASGADTDKQQSKSRPDKQHSFDQQKSRVRQIIASRENSTKLDALNGKIKLVGSGRTESGPVHEISVGFAMELIDKNPDASDEAIVNTLVDVVGETAKGKSLLKTGKRGVSDVQLRKILHYAVDSARAEMQRVDFAVKNNNMNRKKCLIQHYHGNTESKKDLGETLGKMSEEGYSIITSRGLKMQMDDILEIIKYSGESKHANNMGTPSDTFIVTIDPSSKKIIFSGSSNKTQRQDQSFNSIITADLKSYRDSLEELTTSGALPTKALSAVEGQLAKTDDILNKLKTAATALFGDAVDTLLKNKKAISAFESWVSDTPAKGSHKNIPSYFESAVGKFMSLPKSGTRRDHIIQSLKQAGWKEGSPIEYETAQKAWLHSMKNRIRGDGKLTDNEQKLLERFFRSSDGKSFNVKVDSTSLRLRALKALQARHEILSKIKCTIDGKKLPVSNVVLGLFAVKSLHLEESLRNIPGINGNSVYVKYKCHFKAVTGDIVNYPASVQKSLGVKRFADFCEHLSLSKPQIAQRHGGEEGEAGTIVFDILFTRKNDTPFALLQRVIRTKGKVAELNVVVIPAKDYTDSLADNQPKKLKNESVLTEDTTPSYYKRFHGVPPEILSRELTYNPIDPKTGRLRIDPKTGAPKIQKVKLSNVLFTPSKYQKYPSLVNMAHNMAAPYMDRQKAADEKPDDAPMPEPGISTATQPQSNMGSTMGGTGQQADTPPTAGSLTFNPMPVPKIGHVLPQNHHDAIKAQFSVQMLKHLSPYKNKRMAEKHLALLLITVLYHFKKHKKSILRKFFGGRSDFNVLKRLAKQIAETFPQDQQLISAAVDTLDSNGGDLVFTFKEDVIRIVDFDGFAKGLNVHVEGDNAEQRVGKLMTKLLPINVLQQGSTHFFVHDILSPVDDLSLIGSEKLSTETDRVVYSVTNINPTDLLVATSNENGDGYFITFADDLKELLDLV